MRGPVVSDAGPIHYLILVDCANLLEKLFERVVIPRGVHSELTHRNTPKKVTDWMSVTRPWFVDQSVRGPRRIAGLHSGESEAIQLGLQLKARAVLMDDLDGRAAARRLGFTVVGTLGILERASEFGFVDLSRAIADLGQTNFFISPELLNTVLERDRARREAGRKKNLPGF